MTDEDQLAALARVDELLDANDIDYWLFGGWAVDFHAGSVTRPHDDVDIAIWLDDHERIAGLLAADGWRHAPEPDEEGGTGYERNGVRLELTFLVRDDDGRIATPLRSRAALWGDGTFEHDTATMRGVRARVVSVGSLRATKGRGRDDPEEAAKDRADAAVLDRLDQP